MSDYTTVKKSQIAAAIAGVLVGQGVTVPLSAINIIVEALSRRLSVEPRRALNSGVTITAEITVPSSSSLGDINSKLSSSAAETAMKASLNSAGISVTAYSVDAGGGGGAGCGGGCIAGIVIGVIVGVALLAVLGMLLKKKTQSEVTVQKGEASPA